MIMHSIVYINFPSESHLLIITSQKHIRPYSYNGCYIDVGKGLDSTEVTGEVLLTKRYRVRTSTKVILF